MKTNETNMPEIMMVGGVVVLTAILFATFAPAAYVLGMLALALVGVLGLTMVVAGRMLSNGNILDWIIADSIIRAGFEVAGWILYGMVKVVAASAGASCND